MTNWGVSLYNAGLKTPTGYYRDHSGQVRPIFHSEGGVREPSANAEEWSNGLTDHQRAAISSVWTRGGSMSIRDIAKSNLPPTISAVDGVAPKDVYDYWREQLSLTNEAVHSAPQAKGTIYRGVVGMNNRTFDRITRAKVFTTKGPASFTTDPERVPIAHASGVNSVMFIAEHHNAGDIATLSAFPGESEAVVPQGSVYRVVRKNIVRNRSGDGGTAQIVVALDDGKAPRGAVEMAEPKYEGPPKVSQESVDFESPAQGLDHCIQCEFFDSPHSCLRVEGRIHPADWCKLFSINEARMAEEPMALTEDELVAMHYERQQKSLYSENDLVAETTEPDSQLSHRIQMASPAGFFKDKMGRTHPIFTSPGGRREPMANDDEWKKNLSEEQYAAVESYWTQGAGKDMRKVAAGGHPEAGHYVRLPGGVESSSEDTYKEILSQLNEAVHTAPQAKGDIYRGVHELSPEGFDRIFNAKTFQTKGPSSFTTDPERSYVSPYDGQNTVTFTAKAGNHNAGDISSVSYFRGEAEAVVPQGSVYHAVRKSFTTDKKGGRSANIEVALGPAKPTDDVVDMAAPKEAPTGFFRKNGKTHPIFTSPGGQREPMADTETWKASLGPDQVHAVKRWIMGGYGDIEAGPKDWHGMKAAAREQSAYSVQTLAGPDNHHTVENDDKEDLDSFNRALHTAPEPNERIGRLVNRLSDDVYNKLVSAKYLKTTAPSSFTVRSPGRNINQTRTDDDPPYNDKDVHHVKIISDYHNAADLRGFNDIEDEAVVPQGSLYHVDKVDFRDQPAVPGFGTWPGVTEGKQTATIHVSVVPHDPEKEKSAVEMAAPDDYFSPSGTKTFAEQQHSASKEEPKGFFRDREGHVHPIFTSRGGKRSPLETTEEWQGKLSDRQKEALTYWYKTTGSKRMKAVAQGRTTAKTEPDLWFEGNEAAQEADKDLWSMRLDDFNRAVHIAPKVSGTIYRGIGVSNEALEKLKNAAVVVAKAPASFTTDRTATNVLAGPNHVLFVANDHNAGDISSLSPFAESEAVVPQGSAYRIVRQLWVGVG